MMHETFFLVRFALYLVRGIVWVTYGVLRFIAKPGSRIIVPVLVLAWYFIVSDPWEYFLWLLYPVLNTLRLAPAYDTLVVRATLVAAFVVFTVAYYYASRALAVIVGTFPTINRPLRPMRRLTTGKRKISSAAVRIAVPPLRMP